jgi:sensor histidine kinase regulating citrate/malate metabolism
VIPEKVALRIFQRSFSTKAKKGRGIGTYSMKLFGERYLGGKVGFETNEEKGTMFFIELPEREPVEASA